MDALAKLKDLSLRAGLFIIYLLASFGCSAMQRSSQVVVSEHDQAELYFSYAFDQDLSFTLRQSDSDPFYVNGLVLQNRLTENQFQRFAVKETVFRSLSFIVVKLTISDIRPEDSATYICDVFKNEIIISEGTQRVGLTVEYLPRKPSCTLLDIHLFPIDKRNHHVIECIAPVGTIPGSIICFQHSEKLPAETDLNQNASVLIQHFVVRGEVPVQCCSSDLSGKRIGPCANFSWPFPDDLSRHNQNMLNDHGNHMKSTTMTMIAGRVKEYTGLEATPVATNNVEVQLQFTPETQLIESLLVNVSDNNQSVVLTTSEPTSNSKSDVMREASTGKPTTPLEVPPKSKTLSSVTTGNKEVKLPPTKVRSSEMALNTLPSDLNSVVLFPLKVNDEMKIARTNMNIIWTAIIIVVGVPLCACIFALCTALFNKHLLQANGRQTPFVNEILSTSTTNHNASRIRVHDLAGLAVHESNAISNPLSPTGATESHLYEKPEIQFHKYDEKNIDYGYPDTVYTTRISKTWSDGDWSTSSDTVSSSSSTSSTNESSKSERSSGMSSISCDL